jgi:hypothetical protein
MQLLIAPDGSLRCLYDETIDLTALGSLQIQRGSHVEPDDAGQWWADMSPVSGPRLGPFSHRSLALDAERAWLEANWLLPPGSMKGGCSCVT